MEQARGSAASTWRRSIRLHEGLGDELVCAIVHKDWQSETTKAPPWQRRFSHCASLQALRRILLRIENETGKAVSQKQLSPVGLSLSQQRQQRVPHLCRNFFCPENFERDRKSTR